nr:LacI family DNA-binding transcriptional regulator [Limosilactobacillus reuteri]
MKPTIKDIAQRAHVSTATVSRVLSKKANPTVPKLRLRLKQSLKN